MDTSRTQTEQEQSGRSIADNTSGDYELLDSGNERKLERVGPYMLDRPSPQAIWRPALPEHEWNRADAIYARREGGGNWEWRSSVRREYEILFDRLALQIKLTDFGHLGLFPEQAENWGWLRKVIRDRQYGNPGRNVHVLNLFAYTGGSTLAASQAGAHVVHVDAAKGVVDWARKNAELSRLNDRPIRWLVDDALKFVRREARRNNRYHGIIFDPPSFGRGPKGEVFKIEADLPPLLDEIRGLLANDALFVLYSGHTPGFTPLVMRNQLEDLMSGRDGTLEAGEMTVRDRRGRDLPSGTYARWLAK